MSTYRDILTGTIITVATGSAPPPSGDPIDVDAINDLWAAGPRLLPLQRQQWSNVPVTPATIYWVSVSPGVYQLTGAGAALGPQGRGIGQSAMSQCRED
jgi:hypothetical protein